LGRFDGNAEGLKNIKEMTKEMTKDTRYRTKLRSPRKKTWVLG
jgi:hypothetical protein